MSMRLPPNVPIAVRLRAFSFARPVVIAVVAIAPSIALAGAPPPTGLPTAPVVNPATPHHVAARTMQGFRAGEGFAYTFSVGSIDAGRARISVGDPVMSAGRRTLTVSGDAHSAPWLALLARLDDDYRVQIDVESLAPRKLNILEKGLRDRKLDMTLDPAGAQTRVHMDLVRPKEERHENANVIGMPLEPAAALFTMRATPWRIGESIEMIAFDGPTFYKATATATKHETLEQKGEHLAVIRIDVVALRIDIAGKETGQAPRRATLWLSDDEKRIPYRIAGDTDFGRCELELVSYREGKEPSVARRPPAAVRKSGSGTPHKISDAAADLAR